MLIPSQVCQQNVFAWVHTFQPVPSLSKLIGLYYGIS